MRELRNTKIIAVDYGYGNMKTANTVTPTGIKAYETEPIFTGNILEYNGIYYRIGEGHKEFKVVSRGSGRSAVAASAYMSCSRMYNDYDGIQHDYTRKQGLIYQKVMLHPNGLTGNNSTQHHNKNPIYRYQTNACEYSFLS